MNIDLVPERNFRERISGYYYFEFDDTKKIMNEEQKFVKTCEITFTRLNKVFRQIDYSDFQDSVLEDLRVNEASYNPKVFLFVFFFTYTKISDGTFVLNFSKQKIKECMEYIEKANNSDNEIDSDMIDLIKESGITSENVIRYFIFYEKNLNNLIFNK
tara:strand:+ start:459 stop:932 length:474 start_codon:yes stop_codon:yes gene_type:complete